MKFLYLLRRSMHLAALHHLHSGEGHHRLLFLMNLVIYLLTHLLLPWRLIVRLTTVVVIIRLKNPLVDLSVKASYCNILCHHDRRTTLDILHTLTIITIPSLVHNRDQRRHLPRVAVPDLLRFKLTQVVNLLGLHSPTRLPLSALCVYMCHMNKTILPSKKAIGTDGLLQLITVIGEDRRPRHDYVSHPPQPYSFYPPHSPRAHSPTAPSPRHGARYWDNKPTMSGPPSSQPGFRTSPPPQQQQQPPSHHEQQDRRYDPRHDARESRDYEPERHDSRSYPVSPEGTRRNPPPHVVASRNSRSSESPHPGPAMKVVTYQ